VNDDAGGSAVGLVTITVADMIWFVDSSTAAGGNGNLAAPFDSLPASAGGTGDCIFIADGAYTGPLALAINQVVVGEGAIPDISTVCGITLAPDSATPIAHRVARYLERQGLLERDVGNRYLTAEGVDTDRESPTNQLLGSSITYHIALGPQQGRKVFALQTLPDCRPENPLAQMVGKVAGLSLHAVVTTKAHERDKLECLCRYITRPPLSTKRLSLPRHGKVRYELKTPYSDGTTHIIFEPLDFIAKLVALVPKPRVNLTRYHGVFAPNSKYRIQAPDIYQ